MLVRKTKCQDYDLDEAAPVLVCTGRLEMGFAWGHV